MSRRPVTHCLRSVVCLKFGVLAEGGRKEGQKSKCQDSERKAGSKKDWWKDSLKQYRKIKNPPIENMARVSQELKSHNHKVHKE